MLSLLCGVVHTQCASSCSEFSSGLFLTERAAAVPACSHANIKLLWRRASSSPAGKDTPKSEVFQPHACAGVQVPAYTVVCLCSEHPPILQPRW